MAGFLLPPTSPDNVPVPEAGKVYVFINSDSDMLYMKDSSGTSTSLKGDDGLLTGASSSQTAAMTSSDVAVTPASLAPLLQYDHFSIPISAFSPRATNGAEVLFGTEFPTNDHVRPAYAFDSATKEYIEYNWTPPDTVDISSGIKAKFKWRPGDSAASVGDTVEWEIAMVATGDGDTTDVAAGTAQVISDTVLTGVDQTDHISGATPTITVAGSYQTGDTITIVVARNVSGTDDMTEDAHLEEVVLEVKHANTVSAWS
jgi:hypothetical protein